VRLYLCRHAHADPGEPDASRPLSARGESEAGALADSLAGTDEPPVLILSSPLLRAQQTAAAIAGATGAALRSDDRLAPGATVDSLRDAVAGLDGPIAIVGHQPDCSEIALALTGSDPGFAPGDCAALALGDPT
jgi:phosphohistidine phosphatase